MTSSSETAFTPRTMTIEAYRHAPLPDQLFGQAVARELGEIDTGTRGA